MINEHIIDKILIMHDIPLLFTLKDYLAQSYLCLLTIENQNENEYIAIRNYENELDEFLEGELDLRKLFINHSDKWYKIIIGNNGVQISDLQVGMIPEEYLPEADYYWESEPIIEEAKIREHLVINLKIEDEKERNSVDALVLSDILSTFQNYLKNSFKKLISESSQRTMLDNEENYTLNVFAFSKGSLKIHLESDSKSRLDASYPLEIALEKLDELIDDNLNDEILTEKMFQIKGHSINNYKKLLELIVDNKLSFRYKWVSFDRKVHSRYINNEYAYKTSKLLEKKDELSREYKKFVGYVKQADVEKMNWRIFNIEDNKEYRGESPNVKLDGITLETVKYIFKCEEIIEESYVTHKEKKKYVLSEYNKTE